VSFGKPQQAVTGRVVPPVPRIYQLDDSTLNDKQFFASRGDKPTRFSPMAKDCRRSRIGRFAQRPFAQRLSQLKAGCTGASILGSAYYRMRVSYSPHARLTASGRCQPLYPTSAKYLQHPVARARHGPGQYGSFQQSMTILIDVGYAGQLLSIPFTLTLRLLTHAR